MSNQLNSVNGNFVPAPQLIAQGVYASRYGVLVGNKLIIVDMALNKYEYTVPVDVDDVLVCRLVDDDKMVLFTSTEYCLYKLMDDGTVLEVTKTSYNGALAAFIDKKTVLLSSSKDTICVGRIEAVDDREIFGNHTFTQDINDEFVLCGYSKGTKQGLLIQHDVSENETLRYFVFCRDVFENELLHRLSDGDNVYAALKDVQGKQYGRYAITDELYLIATADGIKLQLNGYDAAAFENASFLTPMENLPVSNTMQWLTKGLVACQGRFYKPVALLNTGSPLYVSEDQDNFEIDKVYACDTDYDVFRAIVTSHGNADAHLCADVITVSSSGLIVSRKFMFAVVDGVNDIHTVFTDVVNKKHVLLVHEDLSRFMSNGQLQNVTIDDMTVVVNDNIYAIYDANEQRVFHGVKDTVGQNGQHWYVLVADFDGNILSLVDLPVVSAVLKLVVTGNGDAFVVTVSDDHLTFINGKTVITCDTTLPANTQVAWVCQDIGDNALVGLTTGQVFMVNKNMTATELTGNKVYNILTTTTELFTVSDNRIYSVTIDNNVVTVRDDMSYVLPAGKTLAVRRDEEGVHAFTEKNGIVYITLLQHEE